MVDQRFHGAPTGDPAAEQLAQLRAENAALLAQLNEQPQRRSGRFRMIASRIIAVLAVVSVVAGIHAVWLRTTIADEDRFVASFAPLPKEPAVAAALSERLADELMVAAGVTTVVERNLPEDLGFLALPITEGLRNVTADTADAMIQSDVFTGIWQFALRASHNAASLVLSTNGSLTIDLNDAAALVVSNLEDRGVTILSDQDIEIPELVLFENEQLQAAADTLNTIDALGWVLPIVALALIVIAIAVSPNRRRAVAGLGFGTAIAILVTLVAVRLARAATVSEINDDVHREAAEAVWNTTLRFYRQSMWASMALALIVGFVAWVAGPSARARRLREWLRRASGRWQGDTAAAPPNSFAGLVARWKRPIQWAAITVGLFFVLFAPSVSWWLVIITALIVVVVAAATEAIAGPTPPTPSDTELASNTHR